MSKYSEYLKTRVHTRGADRGFCAICRKHELLSRDHVPPAGCGNIKDVELRIAFSTEKDLKTYSQGGAHFKTICRHCNSTLLGTQYDPELIKFHTEVMRFVKAKSQRITIPEQSTHYIKPHLIAKSIVGHVLAANAVDLINNDKKHSPHAEKLANYVLSADALLPDDIDIFFWLYPYRDIRVIKYLGISSFNWHGNFICDVIKFLPFAFLITNGLPQNIKIHHQKLIKNKKAPVGSMDFIHINYSDFPKQGFPEYPTDDDNHFVLAHDQSTSIGKLREKV